MAVIKFAWFGNTSVSQFIPTGKKKDIASPVIGKNHGEIKIPAKKSIIAPVRDIDSSVIELNRLTGIKVKNSLPKVKQKKNIDSICPL